MENVEKIAGSIKSVSFYKFDNLNDYIEGVVSLTETLEEWVSKADVGFDRKFTTKKHNDDLKLEVELEVIPHESK